MFKLFVFLALVAFAVAAPKPAPQIYSTGLYGGAYGALGYSNLGYSSLGYSNLGYGSLGYAGYSPSYSYGLGYSYY